jgi:hypothetical protein
MEVNKMSFKNLKVNKKNMSLLAIVLTLGTAIVACGSSSTGAGEADEVINSILELEPPVLQGNPDTTRSDPASPGSEGSVEGMTIVVTDVTRPANDIVAASSDFALPPSPGKEYILVELEITCEGSYDERCLFEVYNLKIVGDTGVISYFDWGVAEIEGLLDDAEFFGEAVLSGTALFTIDRDETGLILLYDSYYDHPLFLALPDGETE